MSAIGGKADLTVCRCPLSRSLLGVKRTCPFALHMSAFDPKRTCRFWQRRRRAGLPVTVRIQKVDTGEYNRINVLSPFWLSTRSQAQNLKLTHGGATCCRHSKQLRQNRVHPRRRNEPKVL